MSYSIRARRAAGGAALHYRSPPGGGDVCALAQARRSGKASGARIGVAAIDTGNGNALFCRENERFLMCSTFKLSLAAAVLARADAGQEKLDRVVHYSQSDLAGRLARHHRKSLPPA